MGRRRTNCLRCDGSMKMALSEISTDYCPSCCASIVDACHGLDAEDVRKAIKAVAALKIQKLVGHVRGCLCVGCMNAQTCIDEAVSGMTFELASDTLLGE